MQGTSRATRIRPSTVNVSVEQLGRNPAYDSGYVTAFVDNNPHIVSQFDIQSMPINKK